MLMCTNTLAAAAGGASGAAVNLLRCLLYVGDVAVFLANATLLRRDPWKPTETSLRLNTNLSICTRQELRHFTVNQGEGANRRAVQILRVPRLQEKASELGPRQCN